MKNILSMNRRLSIKNPNFARINFLRFFYALCKNFIGFQTNQCLCLLLN